MVTLTGPPVLTEWLASRTLGDAGGCVGLSRGYRRMKERARPSGLMDDGGRAWRSSSCPSPGTLMRCCVHTAWHPEPGHSATTGQPLVPAHASRGHSVPPTFIWHLLCESRWERTFQSLGAQTDMCSRHPSQDAGGGGTEGRLPPAPKPQPPGLWTALQAWASGGRRKCFVNRGCLPTTSQLVSGPIRGS